MIKVTSQTSGEKMIYSITDVGISGKPSGKR